MKKCISPICILILISSLKINAQEVNLLYEKIYPFAVMDFGNRTNQVFLESIDNPADDIFLLEGCFNNEWTQLQINERTGDLLENFPVTNDCYELELPNGNFVRSTLIRGCKIIEILDRQGNVLVESPNYQEILSRTSEFLADDDGNFYAYHHYLIADGVSESRSFLRVVKFNEEAGRIWQTQPDIELSSFSANFIAFPLLIDEEALYFRIRPRDTGNPHNLVKIDKFSGEEIWRISLPPHGLGFTEFSGINLRSNAFFAYSESFSATWGFNFIDQSEGVIEERFSTDLPSTSSYVYPFELPSGNILALAERGAANACIQCETFIGERYELFLLSREGELIWREIILPDVLSTENTQLRIHAANENEVLLKGIRNDSLWLVRLEIEQLLQGELEILQESPNPRPDLEEIDLSLFPVSCPPDLLSAVLDATPTTGVAANGTIIIDVEAGTGPYVVKYSGQSPLVIDGNISGESPLTIPNLPAGAYDITIIDAMDNVQVLSILIACSNATTPLDPAISTTLGIGTTVDNITSTTVNPLMIDLPRDKNAVYTGVYDSVEEIPTYQEMLGSNYAISAAENGKIESEMLDIFSHPRLFLFHNKDYWKDGLEENFMLQGAKTLTYTPSKPDQIGNLRLWVDATGVPILRNSHQPGDREIFIDCTGQLAERLLSASEFKDTDGPETGSMYKNYLNNNFIKVNATYDKHNPTVGNTTPVKVNITLNLVDGFFPKNLVDLGFYKFPRDWWTKSDWGNSPDNIRYNARMYAKMFARTYGPKSTDCSNCKQLVEVLEIGNEPWAYAGTTYNAILEGFIEGFAEYYNSANPDDWNIKLLPAAFQGFHLENSVLQPDNPNSSVEFNADNWKDYFGTRITTAYKEHLEGINLHPYSNQLSDNVSGNEFDKRLLAYPEELNGSSNDSKFLYIRNAWKWNQDNMPIGSRKIYVSEFGWDTRLKFNDVDTCKGGGVGIGEIPQGIYINRALLMMGRMGVHRAELFEASDDADLNELSCTKSFAYHSSGIYDINNAPKASKNILKKTIQVIGNKKFHYSIKESGILDPTETVDDNIYAYILETSGQPSHLVVWNAVGINEMGWTGIRAMSSPPTFINLTLAGQSYSVDNSQPWYYLDNQVGTSLSPSEKNDLYNVSTNRFTVIPIPVVIPIKSPISCSPDLIPPSITNCPNTINITSFDGAPVMVSWSAPQATDNCDNPVNLSVSHPIGSNFSVGITTVEYTATDQGGNTATCSFDVNIVQDLESIDCADVIVSSDNNIIKIDKLNAPIDIVKVYKIDPINGSFSLVFDCNNNCNNPTETGTLMDGNYRVEVNLFKEGYDPICDTIFNINLTGGNTGGGGGNIDGVDIAVDLQVNDASPAIFETVIYTLTATNQGNTDATNVTINFDYGAQEPSATKPLARTMPFPPANYNYWVGIWNIGNIPAGNTVTLEVPLFVRSPAAPSTTLTASLNMATPMDMSASNDVSSATITITNNLIQSNTTISNWLIYPNPTKNVVALRWQHELDESVQLQVFNLQGKVVIQRPLLLDKGFNHIEINVEHLPSGVYYLHLQNSVEAALPLRFVKN